MSTPQLVARNADLADIKRVLDDQRARRLDIVAPSGAIESIGGLIEIDGTEAPLITDTGVETVRGRFLPTLPGDESLANRFGIPAAWLKELREIGRPDVYDSTVNGLIHGSVYTGQNAPDGTPYPAHEGRHLLRLLQGDPGEPGVLRAALSDRYKIMDNLDVLLAVLRGARDSGVEVHVGACDLSERRMYVRLEAPAIATVAPLLLDGYRSQLDGPAGRERAGGLRREDSRAWAVGRQHAEALVRDLPGGPGGSRRPQVGDVVWAGLVLSNSDVGNGARYLAPQVRVLACTNGITIGKEASRRIHLGAAQEEGIIDWSTETVERELELITAQVRDSVVAWLSQGFLEEQVNAIEVHAGAPVLRPEQTIREVTKAAGFTKAQAEDILGFFVQGGQLTAGGVLNAVTAYAQTVPSADLAADLEAKALPMLEHAAKIGS
jgi:hypothetical protein